MSWRSDTASDPHDVLRDAAIEAQRIFRHLEPRGPHCKRTISTLTDIFDGPAVRGALAATKTQRRD